MGKEPRKISDDRTGTKSDEDAGPGLDNEGRPRDPDRREGPEPIPPPPD